MTVSRFGTGNGRLPSSHETGRLSTLQGVKSSRAEQRDRAFSGERQPGLQGEVSHFKAIKSRVRFSPNSGDRLLKWLNSLYRPALPEGIRAAIVRRFPDSLLGRRQVVRQWILIPPYGGSNPPAPANKSMTYKTQTFMG